MGSLMLPLYRAFLMAVIFVLPVGAFAQQAAQQAKVSPAQVRSATQVDGQIKLMGSSATTNTAKNVHYYTVTPSRYPSGSKPVLISYEPPADSTREVKKHANATGAAKVPVKVGGSGH
jgi:hypothetical protein